MSSINPIPTLLTSLPVMTFATEKIPGCTNEAPRGANKAPINAPSWFFISCFTVSGAPSINAPESSNDFTITFYNIIYIFIRNK